MPLYFVVRHEDIGVDENQAHVIRAENESHARYIASDAAMDEGKKVWHDTEKVKVKHIQEIGLYGIILTSARSA